MSLWLYNIFIHTDYIEYVITNMLSMSFWLNIIYVFMALWLNTIYTFMSFCIVFSIFICMKKPQDINGLKKNHYLCIRISYPKK